MSLQITIGLFTIVIIVVVAYFMNKKPSTKEKTGSDTGDDTGDDTGTEGVTLVIDETGSKKEDSGTENFIEMPYSRCRTSSNLQPSFCSRITKQTGMNYVYDEINGKIDVSNGEFITGFDDNTYACNGITDCVYKEIYNDSGNIIVGIQNSSGDDFIQKVADGVWDGTINLNTVTITGKTFADHLKDITEFNENTGELFINNPGRTPPRVKVAPGTGINDEIDENDVLRVPLGRMLVYILFHHKVNNLPKPDIKLNIKVPGKFGQKWYDTYGPGAGSG